MNSSEHDPAAAPGAQQNAAAFKSKGGLGRILNAARYSLLGLRAGWRHEAAFRQELLLAACLLPLVPLLAPSLLYALLMVGAMLLVFCVEMINSAIEALADTISPDYHPMIGRAKDFGSAAVMFSLLLCGLVWLAALVERFS